MYQHLEGLYYSFSQFMVFDEQKRLSIPVWTETHSKQGFCRLPSYVCFGTTLEFGNATVNVVIGKFSFLREYDRIIEVPFEVVSGSVEISAPDDHESLGRVHILRGHYRLTAAQQVENYAVDIQYGDGDIIVDLFFELLELPISTSRIIRADSALNPPIELLETADVL